MISLLKNYFSTVSFILLIYIFYRYIPYSQNGIVPFYQDMLLRELQIPSLHFNIESRTIFQSIISLYILILPIFYVFHTEKSKALIVIEYIGKKVKNIHYSMNRKEKISILAWMVKGFWAPLMIFWLSDHIVNMINNTVMTYGSLALWKINFLGFFDTYFFHFCFSVILFLDVLFFTLGYLVESEKLGNTIKSVEPTFFGWLVTLICYPPFNSFITGGIGVFGLFVIPGIGWYSQEFPHFESTNTHIILNTLILILMALYTSASVSLGLKASNLTNRGIVSTGLYKYIRHPAYLCKNTAWWIGGLPFIIQAVKTSDWKYLLFILLGLTGWSVIYFLRAWTEERHLGQDPDYIDYKKRVKYRFIPGIF